jgi:shikimate 5-dehydrogenase
MLLEQGAAQSELWLGRRAAMEEMKSAVFDTGLDKIDYV